MVRGTHGKRNVGLSHCWVIYPRDAKVPPPVDGNEAWVVAIFGWTNLASFVDSMGWSL